MHRLCAATCNISAQGFVPLPNEVCVLLNFMMFASLYRLLREETEEAEALREKEATEEAERQRVRASIMGRLKRPASPLAELTLPA